jgi:hypothetical protein
VIWGSGEQNYFCERDSTDPISGSPSGKSLPMKQHRRVGAQALIDAPIVEQNNNQGADSLARIQMCWHV